MPKAESLAGYLHFFWAGLASHMQTGALFPSQKALVERMIEPIPRNYRGRVLELGAGTGTLTLPLALRCGHAHIVACELNPVLAADTRQSLARAGIDGQVEVRVQPAQEVLADLIKEPDDKPGFVISGLPLGNWSGRNVLELLESIRLALPRNGVFIQAQHLLWDRRKIRRTFGTIRTIPVLRNLPPVFVYYAFNQRAGVEPPVV